MKRFFRLLSKIELIFFFLIGALIGVITLILAFTPIPQNKEWVVPSEAVKKSNPVASNPQSIADGKIIFIKNCYDCHGMKGKGDGPKGGDFEISPGNFTKEDFQEQTDGAVFWKISEGRKPMPSFKKDLTEIQRWTVINYVRTLGIKK
jgi:mono/diheme cytochrome c family protein